VFNNQLEMCVLYENNIGDNNGIINNQWIQKHTFIMDEFLDGNIKHITITFDINFIFEAKGNYSSD